MLIPCVSIIYRSHDIEFTNDLVSVDREEE